MGLEIEAVSKLGQSVALRAATEWLASHTDERTMSLTELAAAELSKPTHRAKLDTLIQHIGHQVTEQLESALERFTDDDVASSLTAVEEALSSIDLSDAALLADDADPELLAQRIRRSLPRQDRGRCYEITLDQSCRYLVQIIRNLPPFQPRALAEVLSRATASAAMLDDVLSRLPRTSLYAPQGTDNDGDFRDEYLRYIGANLDRLELLGLSMRDRPSLPLSVAYLGLTVSGRKRRQGNWFSEPDHRAHSGVRVESALVDRTYVRGEAGSGKTTLLDWIAVTAARGGFVGNLQSWNDLVPFPIRLRAYADDPLPTRPEEFVTGWLAGIMPPGWVHRILQSGKGLLLVDGVDEVRPDRRQKVRQWLRELLQAFPSARVVVTARPAATDDKWLAELNFSSVELEQMSPGDVKVFLQRWHEAAGAPEEAHRRLVVQLESRQHLQGLASSPLLCAMLCALNLGRVSELPHSRMELYNAALTMLLDLRDAERGIARILTTSDQTVLLRDLAWRLTLGGLSQLPTAKMREHVTRKVCSMPNVDEDPDVIVAHLLERSGVIREPVPGRVDFVHRTFQEYLAGEEAMQDGQVETLVAHAHQDSWTQTIVLACGHGQRTQVTELLTGVLARADREPRNVRRLRLLAAACLETVRDVDADVCDQVDAIIRDRLVPPRSAKETMSLATIGHRVLRYLPASLDELSEAVAAATVHSAALVGSPEAMAKLAGYAHDPREAVQEALMEAWLSFDLQRYAEEVLADAPLDDGIARIQSVRLYPHLFRLRNLTGVDVWLPRHESQPDLRGVAELPPLRHLFLWMHGRIDLSEPAETTPQMIYLSGAQRYTNITIASEVHTFGLNQREPWDDLGFLRGRSVGHLYLSEAAPGCDLSPLSEVVGLEAVYAHNWRELEIFKEMPELKTLRLIGDEPIDVRPLRDLSLNLLLQRRCSYVGVEALGPDVKVTWKA
ncbi:NACHT domain-containing protein [Lentzea sp. BCCO 10_0061]|uniref:NACHT domain-containing protein n=1 Tax=Lentzea sokolovensis TaxID=3095429 RepID=A0ABU4V424_9PSEU|nr:NACHT domain-containing protein [Lentzea sp. BCCO 10_0061]MDX8145984.1 NACHT domain-containing protein [Lentzea sp. BCCO 10_0061]